MVMIGKCDDRSVDALRADVDMSGCHVLDVRDLCTGQKNLDISIQKVGGRSIL
jgi:hypothetical protein